MEFRPTITPLPPRRGHAGILATGVLVATTTVVWLSRGDDPPNVDPRPAPAATIPAPPEPGPTAIELGPEATMMLVAEREIPRVVTATGTVTFDDSRTNHLRSPVAGVLVKPRSTSLGRVVRAGEIVGVVYSLEVLTATTDLLTELRDFRGQEYLDRERMRLLRWGMRRDQLSKIEQSMTPSAALPIIARVTGKVVIEEGEQRKLIEPSGDLMTITDPTYASIYVDIPVDDAALLKVGQATRVALGTARTITAPLGYLSRSADGMKTARVDLHPIPVKASWKDVEATIELARVMARGPSIPTSAVIRHGERTFVYVVRGEIAEPRDVRLGPVGDGFVLVETGLVNGEWIVLPSGGAPQT
jgi:Cu(I)/Ag(I) efflux system membrane fusion protein